MGVKLFLPVYTSAGPTGGTLLHSSTPEASTQNFNGFNLQQKNEKLVTKDKGNNAATLERRPHRRRCSTY